MALQNLHRVLGVRLAEAVLAQGQERDARLAHPFLRSLTDGTLPKYSFHFYVLQSTFSVCKKSAFSGKAPVISATLSGCIATDSLSIL